MSGYDLPITDNIIPAVPSPSQHSSDCAGFAAPMRALRRVRPIFTLWPQIPINCARTGCHWLTLFIHRDNSIFNCIVRHLRKAFFDLSWFLWHIFISLGHKLSLLPRHPSHLVFTLCDNHDNSPNHLISQPQRNSTLGGELEYLAKFLTAYLHLFHSHSSYCWFLVYQKGRPHPSIPDPDPQNIRATLLRRWSAPLWTNTEGVDRHHLVFLKLKSTSRADEPHLIPP